MTMVFYMPERAEDMQRQDPDGRSPRQIVADLDRHVVGQTRAKRAVAIALRNRIRRQRLPPEMADEVARVHEDAVEGIVPTRVDP